MNILVTGAAGFIASHLIEELLKDSSNKIFGIDNFHSGTKENINFINSIDNKKQFIFKEGDIRDIKLLSSIIKGNAIEQIYHMAAIVSVQESINNPLLSHEVNIKGTLNLLESAKDNNVKRIVFSSSAAVYGDEPSLPKDENSKVKPISPYGCEKLVGEYYMNLYHELCGIETISLRYFNVYGERQLATSDYSGVISIFENKLKNEEIPNIYGDGEQYRDFIYVKDIVKVNILAMNSKDIRNELFCVGTGIKTSINQLFKIIQKKYLRNINANYLESRNGDILESISNNKKIVKTLDINTFITFDEGIFKI